MKEQWTSMCDAFMLLEILQDFVIEQVVTLVGSPTREDAVTSGLWWQ